ncbi:MAG: hypothetical protein EBT97_11575 [Actinobacteria bacterium]|nr:hypothetical protein [Actinomycetota bacterium]
MAVYSYVNAVLDANPDVVAIAAGATAYGVLVGPPPPGEEDITLRVSIVLGDALAYDTLIIGYDSNATVRVQFIA